MSNNNPHAHLEPMLAWFRIEAANETLPSGVREIAADHERRLRFGGTRIPQLLDEHAARCKDAANVAAYYRDQMVGRSLSVYELEVMSAAYLIAGWSARAIARLEMFRRGI
jgi:hypothetical protein